MSRLLIVGVYNKTDAFPNVKYKVDGLKKISSLSVIERHYELTTKIKYGSFFRRALSILSLVVEMSLKSISCVVILLKDREISTIYIPYPSLSVLLLLSIVPKKWRPKTIVVDMFICIYDTVVFDREIFKGSSLLARALLKLESRACTVADILVTDTRINSLFYSELLNVDRKKFIDVPLSISEKYVPSCQSINARGNKPLRILFVGTLVPLHNLRYICTSIERMTPVGKVEFSFIGNGQDAPILQRFFDAKAWSSNVSCLWKQNWMSTDELVLEVNNTDICLGIFGVVGKGQRVWPYKNYIYLACGKPVVTGRSVVSESLFGDNDDSPCFQVDCATESALTDLLEELVRYPEKVALASLSARRFFDKYFASDVALGKMRNIFESRNEMSGS